VITPLPPTTPPPDPALSRGTLVYTKKTLFSVFFWILWGDFCLQFMEVVVASVLPVMMSQWKAPAILIGLFVTTIPGLFNFVITPLVSVWSDRHRGRLGRRIPFLLVPTPFVVLFLLGIAGTEPLARGLVALTGGAVTFEAGRLVVLGLMIVAFQVAHMVVASVYYYLFNDVVPEPRMGRFLGLFRVVSIAAGACFHFFVFGHANEHAAAIFAWSALLYGLGFGMMCLKVREGEYPAPDAVDARHPFHAALVLLKECFSTRFFRTYALFNGALAFAMAWNAFLQVMRVNVGVSYANIGMLMGIASGISALTSYPVGVFVDRFRPFVVAIAGLALLAAGQLLYLPLFSPALPASSAFTVMGMAVLVTTVGLSVFQGAAMALHMYVFPKERYGQFCGSLAMLNSLAAMAGGLVAGGLTSVVESLWGDRAGWLFAPVGMFASLAFCLGLLVRSRQLWERRNS